MDKTKDKTKAVRGSAVTMCVLAMLFYYYEYYLRVAPSVMNTELKLTFNLSEAAFGNLAAFFYYAYTPMQIPVGMMMDRFGPRRLLTFACFVCVLGTVLFVITGHFWIAAAGRFLLGFGSAFAYVGMLKLSNLWLPKKYFAFMAGFCTTLGMFGGISCAVLMSHLMFWVGWQLTLYYSAAAGLVLMVLLWAVLRDGTDSEKHGSSEIDLAHEVHIKVNGLKQIVCSSQMWITGAIGLLTFLPIAGFAEVWAVTFLQTVGLSKFDAATGASMLFLGFAVGAPLWGIISDAMQSRRIPLIIGSFLSAGFMALVVFMPTTSLIWMYALLFLSTFFASVEILIFAVSNDISRHSVSATAIAFANMVVMIGGVLLPPLIGKILDSELLSDNVSVLTASDFSIALAILPLGLVLSGILSLFLKESYHKHPKVVKV
ncbi:MAG TPA: MFS transporter [Gammaproteobacteria bacterium]|nr:MFS transporter [Gammaproteobacteria bacterium]